MNIINVIFVALNIKQTDISGKRVIEVGAYDVNGSVRPLIEALDPGDYIGVDISAGRGVDIVCDACDLIKRFSINCFDVVISTEMLEHVGDWRLVIHNLKNICKPGGIILITSRSYGFFYHGYPYDFWRYELEDMKYIFQDFDIDVLEKDPQYGVMIKAIKPLNFVEADLREHKLYSIIAQKRVRDLEDINFRAFRYAKIAIKEQIRQYLSQIVHFLRSV